MRRHLAGLMIGITIGILLGAATAGAMSGNYVSRAMFENSPEWFKLGYVAGLTDAAASILDMVQHSRD